MQVLLLSHGNLSKEMYETAKLIFGELPDFDYITLPYGMDLNEYKESIRSKLNKDNETLVLIDLFGGSPFMLSSQIFGEENYNHRMEIVTGMNLSMVLEVASRVKDSSLEELKKTALQAGIEGINDLRERLG